MAVKWYAIAAVATITVVAISVGLDSYFTDVLTPPLCLGTTGGFEIANEQGLKWNSTGRILHSNVPIVLSPEELKWQVERQKDEPYWSFHVVSEGEKLYLSYDEDNNEVTMEYETNERKKRLFEARLERDEGMFLKTIENKTRFLTYDNNTKQLVIVETDNPQNTSTWFIKKSFKETSSQDQYRIVQVNECQVSRLWITQNADQNMPIPVKQDSKNQDWRINLNPSGWTFCIYNSNQDTVELYVSQTQNSKPDVIYEKLSEENQIIREYTVVTTEHTGGGVHLQARYSSHFLAVDDVDELFLVESEAKATLWCLDLSRIPYDQSPDGYFPPSCFTE